MKNKPVSRRKFLKRAAGTATAAAAGLSAASIPILQRDTGNTFEELFQKHYKKLNEKELQEILRRIEKSTERQYEAKVKVTDDKPIPGVKFGYALNLSVCIGCRKCVHACLKENNQSRDPQLEYIRVMEMDRGGFDVEKSHHNYEKIVPKKEQFYMPVQCHQCNNPPCTKVCPVTATWKEPDGIVVIDYNYCIGCRYCEAACPYFARRFNFFKPKIKPKEINPDQTYLGNRIRYSGIMEKCTFCIQRTRKKRTPACHDACPTGARKFGNLSDKNSPIRHIIENKFVYIFKEEVATIPSFYYYFD